MIHQITATWAFDEANKQKERRHDVCPECGEEIASEEQADKALRCEKCGASSAADAEQAPETREEAKE